MTEHFREMGLIQIISDTLSIITIVLCLVMKLPQILNLQKVKSSKGINLFALLLELSSYSIMTSYNYTNGYAILSYLEYPVILFQEIILIYLVLKYMNLVNSISWASFGIYLALFSAFLLEIFPKTLLSILAPMCTPISASSKIVQLIALIRSKDSRSISVLTWLISAFTNLTRVFTVYVESADLTLLMNFGIAVSLSTSIMVAAIYYKPNDTPSERKND